MRRSDGSVNFVDKTWNDYLSGFGDPTGEFWIGKFFMNFFLYFKADIIF